MASAELTLRDVAADVRSFADTLEGLEESSPAYEAALVAQATALTQGKDKVERFGRFLWWLDEHSAFLKAEAKRLSAAAAKLEKLEEKLREYAVAAMHDNDVRKLEGHTLAITRRASPPAVAILDEEAVPSAYKILTLKMPVDAWNSIIRQAWGNLDEKTVKALLADCIIFTDVSIDKKAVKRAIENGDDVPGADLCIGNEGISIR